MEQIVAQDQAGRVPRNEIGAKDEGFRDAARRLLDDVLETDAQVRSIAKKIPEARQILWRRDDENIPNPAQHEGRDGVVNHRLVVDGQQLLADRPGDRVQTGASAPGQDNALPSRLCVRCIHDPPS